MSSKRALPALSTCAALAASAAIGIASFSAQAGTATASFLVNITLTASCSITATPLAFGSVGVLSSLANGSSTVSATCSNTTPYTLGLDGGTVTLSTVANRLMAGTTVGNTTTTMQFQLYTDSGHTTQWGNTTGSWVSGTGNGVAQPLTVYGQVPVQTSPKPDTYQTTVTATVTF